MDEQRPWHRLFALSWTDFFRGLPVTVEMEKDLSLKKQLLDVLIIHKEAVTLDCRLPDGFEELATYNLISFKSHQEKLSSWSLKELGAHDVTLRKQVSPSMNEADLLPQEEFRLFAVCVRFPQQLASGTVTLEREREGVYDVQYLDQRIRLVVINQLPLAEQNALLHVYRTRGDLLTYGTEHYRIRSVETSTLLSELFRVYKEEADTMPADALEELTRQTIDRILQELPVTKRLEGLSPKQVVASVGSEKLLPEFSLNDLLKGLTPEQLAAIRRTPEDKTRSGNPDQ